MFRSLILMLALVGTLGVTAAWPQTQSNPGPEDAVQVANQINPAVQSIGDLFAARCSDNALNGVFDSFDR